MAMKQTKELLSTKSKKNQKGTTPIKHTLFFNSVAAGGVFFALFKRLLCFFII
jgi:hypothetical protein